MRDSISVRDELRDSAYAHILCKHKKFIEKSGYIGFFISAMIDAMVGENYQQLEREMRMLVCDRIIRGDAKNVVLYGYGNRGKLLFNQARVFDVSLFFDEVLCE